MPLNCLYQLKINTLTGHAVCRFLYISIRKTRPIFARKHPGKKMVSGTKVQQDNRK